MYVLDGIDEEEEEEKERLSEREIDWVNSMILLVSYVDIYIYDAFVYSTYGIPKVWEYNTLITYNTSTLPLKLENEYPLCPTY